MASIQEYLEKMESGQLEHILAREMYGWDHYPLSTIYLICAILSEREPRRGRAKDLFLEFADRYADNKSISER